MNNSNELFDMDLAQDCKEDSKITLAYRDPHVHPRRDFLALLRTPSSDSKSLQILSDLSISTANPLLR